MSDDWIKWSGGDEPTGLVEIEVEGGSRWTDDASTFSWIIRDDGCNIIAYRFVKES